MTREAEDTRSLVSTLLFVPVIIIFIGVMSGTIMALLRFQAETSSKLTAHAIAGSVSAVSSAPQDAVYCLQMPGGQRKNATIHGIEVDYGDLPEALRGDKSGTKEGGSVVIKSLRGTFRTDIPVTGFSPISFMMPQGSTYVLRITKRSPETIGSADVDQLEVELLREEIDEIDCESVIP